ncbi:alpha-amylase family glycosyl hydrolase [Cerasicoccus arenae]|uniref:Glycosyl hydrolase family 13 catalytic domain-containing protein n=1 Tax=Cerasicoccus arenae TaxID=424488 RepID=A0A8J3DGR8_9BACT|nr:alpha-amylase family glycosyl hydrolase [Cerasicoccus arenae]MBK1857201.1 hypothetical protein [Cerasicoccus arenae]GHB99956.1 hypothetical protein GCM10007047_15210 [Cerasicoccus arenae]
MKPALFLTTIIALSFAHAVAQTPSDRAWNEDIIYFVLTDRFLDGDAANNQPTGSDPTLFDAAQIDINRYHGGDFRGLELALQDGYFNDLGVTALWITPPVRNVWYSAFDSDDEPKTSYHGYWTQDFLDIDPHLTSPQSLSGNAYPDSRDGRMQHYKDLVSLAHSKGIKVIQDIVCNHAGSTFYYDANGNETFDRAKKSEWIQPFKSNGYHSNANWAETPKWNQHRTEPTGSVTILGRQVVQHGTLSDLSSYGRKGMDPSSLGAANGEEVECDFMGLRDFWTKPGSAHFDDLVDDFVEIYAFYIEEIGVDGFRIDTVKHVHPEFWDAFTQRLRKRLGPKRASQVILFGEVYDGNPTTLGRYTYRQDWPQSQEPSLDSLLNFQYCYAIRDYLRTGNSSIGQAQNIENAMRALAPTPPHDATRPYYNQTPGPDGLNSSQKIVNFTENHDGINRFRVQGVSERRNLLANAITLTMPGIPSLYYGTEVALPDPKAKVKDDAETGRLTYLSANQGNPFLHAKQNTNFEAIAELAGWRQNLPALTSTEIHTLWVDNNASNSDDGIFAFVRGDAAPVIVVVNASSRPSTTGIPGHSMSLINSTGQPLLNRNETLEQIPLHGLGDASPQPIQLTWLGDIPQARIKVGPETLNLFRIIPDKHP